MKIITFLSLQIYTLIFTILILNTSCLQFNLKKSLKISDSLSNLQYSNIYNHLITLSYNDQHFTVYDGRQLQYISKIELKRNPVGVSFSHTDLLLVISDNMGYVYFYQKNAIGYNSQAILIFKVTKGDAINSICFSNDDKMIVFGDYSGTLYLYNIDLNREYVLLTLLKKIEFNLTIWSLDWSGNQLVIGGGITKQKMGLLVVYNTTYFRLSHNFTVNYTILSAKFSSDGSMLFVTGEDESIKIWDTVEFILITALETPSNCLYEVQISNNGFYIAAASNSKVYIWNRLNNTSNWLLTQILPNDIAYLAFNKDNGQLLVVANLTNLINQYTLCSSTYYYNQFKDRCQSCFIGCLECTATKCEICNSKQHYVMNQSHCVCSAQYYEKLSKCQLCSDRIQFCWKCSSEEMCTKCSQNIHRELSNGVCICQKGYYDSSKVCERCMIGCLSCNNANECQQCNRDYHFQKKEKMCVCQQKYISSGQICQEQQSQIFLYVVIGLSIILVLLLISLLIWKCLKWSNYGRNWQKHKKYKKKSIISNQPQQSYFIASRNSNQV